ncbi:MAG: glutathione S-transferase family protein [Proteobacteria bacterium]|nr:glutathione S-transferase family protein [Pseudomonadota bacterium]
MNELVMYDLAGADPDRRFSPYCWRAKMALAHKGLPVRAVPWRFMDKDVIAFSGQGRVPVLVDGDTNVNDSWSIAEYLENRYPDRPSLFGGPSGRAVTRFVNSWADRVMVPAVARLVIVDILEHLHERDRDYFRKSREKAFGRPLEEVMADRDTQVLALRQALEPIRATLRAQPFLAGDAPAYADYIPFGVLQWARAISPFRLLEADDPVAEWRGRLLDAFDGLAKRAPGY